MIVLGKERVPEKPARMRKFANCRDHHALVNSASPIPPSELGRTKKAALKEKEKGRYCQCP
jgi:hypothetical protein